MIKKIAKHRFLSNIYTFRFIVSIILCEILFVSSAVILTQDYSDRLTQYNSDITDHEKELDNIYTFSRLATTIDRPPAPLSVLCQGADKRLGTSVVAAFDRAPTIAVESGTRNPLMVVFPKLDLTTIIQVILSLLVILFSYDAISGDRENGVLRLVVSNSISRHSILLGNMIGSILSLLIPLFLGIVSAALIFMINPSISITPDDLMKILLIFLLSAMYLSIFYFLGLFLSSRFRKSATALIFLLLIWVIFIIIIPNTAVHLGKLAVDIPDKSEVNNRAQTLRGEWYGEMQQYVENHPRPAHDYDFIRGRNVYTGDLPYAYRLWYAPREVFQWNHDGSIYGHNLRMEYEDRTLQLYQDYQNRLTVQVNAARIFSMISPAWIFNNISSIISGTSDTQYLSFLDQSLLYRQELIRYMRGKEALSSYRLIARKPPDSFLTHNELLRIRETGGAEAIENIIGPGEGWDSVDPLNLSDIPRFYFVRPDLLQNLPEMLPGLGILLFFNVLFFSLAWVSFQKSDIR